MDWTAASALAMICPTWNRRSPEMSPMLATAFAP
jgi:hypothetical protein